MTSLRRGELKMFQAAASVNEAPKPTIDWYVVFGLTEIVGPLPPPDPKLTSAWRPSKLERSALVSQTPTLGAAEAVWTGTVRQTAATAAAVAVDSTKARGRRAVRDFHDENMTLLAGAVDRHGSGGGPGVSALSGADSRRTSTLQKLFHHETTASSRRQQPDTLR